MGGLKESRLQDSVLFNMTSTIWTLARFSSLSQKGMGLGFRIWVLRFGVCGCKAGVPVQEFMLLANRRVAEAGGRACMCACV